MKITINLDIPLEAEFLAVKGDRSYREITKGMKKSTHSHINQTLLGRNGASLETLRSWGKALGIDVDAAVKQALKEQGL